MKKSIHTAEYTVMLELLRETRQAAGLTQVKLAERLKRTQSVVSKMELGEVRIDVIQLRTICTAIGTTLPAFATKLEERLTKRRQK